MNHSLPLLAALSITAAMALPSTATAAFVANVTDSTALGYSNAPKISVDSDGAAFFLATTLGPDSSPAIRVFRSTGALEGGVKFDSVFIQDRDDFIISTLPRVAASMSRARESNSLHVIWSGKNSSDPSDPDGAPQLRYARIDTAKALAVASREQPFAVTGFDFIYHRPYQAALRWQENPATAVSKDGTLHLVWEARDRHRTDAQGFPTPAIAYATRSSAGAWSLPASVDAPPYLGLNGAGAQFRPAILAEDDGTVHVLCHGDWRGNVQILYGQIKKGRFSGWSPVAENQNDQRYASAALDAQGQLHAVWREGVGGAPGSIVYAMRRKNGRWTAPALVSGGDNFASTPRIAVDESTAPAVSIAWIEWEPGFENSDEETDNGYPQDDETVEGNLMFATKAVSDADFSEPALLRGGVSSYPALATRTGQETPAILWTSGHPCAPQDCVQLYVGAIPAEK